MTGKDRYLSESVKGTDRAARREAEKTMARLQAEVDGQRSAQSRVTLSSTLDEWLKTLEVEDSTRDGYIGYVERNIRPTLGAVPIAKLSTRTRRRSTRSCAVAGSGATAVRPSRTEWRASTRATRPIVRRTSANRWPRRPSGRCTP